MRLWPRSFRRPRKVEERAVEFGSSAIPVYGSNWLSYAGEVVSIGNAAGLPAIWAAIRLVSETIGAMPMLVYSKAGDTRERANGAWQWDLLHERPYPDGSAFDFFAGVCADIEGFGNHYSQKAKSRGRVEALLPIDPQIVDVERADDGSKVFKVRTREGIREFDSSEILHVRGFTLRAQDLMGLSPIAVCRQAIGNALSLQKMEGKHADHGARPGVALKFPQNVTQEQADRWIQLWDSRHRGLDNFGKTGVLGGGAELVDYPISLKDADFIAAMRFSVEDVERIFGLPPGELSGVSGDEQVSAEQRGLQLLTFSLLPRLRRIERALAADPDLFPSSNLFPEFLTDALLRADIQTRYAAYKDARQAGWMTANEIRELENRAPRPEGDVMQETPVGGAPNDQPPSADN